MMEGGLQAVQAAGYHNGARRRLQQCRSSACKYRRHRRSACFVWHDILNALMYGVNIKSPACEMPASRHEPAAEHPATP
jgi:hypothetical protein